MSQWFYAKDGRQSGPVSIDELKTLAAMGNLGRGDLVWNASMKDWQPAGGIDGIFDGTGIPSGTPTPGHGNPYATPDSTWMQLPGTPVVPGEEIEPGSDPIGVGKCIQRGFDLTVKQVLTLVLTTLILFAVIFAVSIPFSIADGVGRLNGSVPMPPSEVMKDPVRAFQWGMRAQLTPMYFVQQLAILAATSFLIAGAFRIALNIVSGVPASVGQLFGQSNKMMRTFALYLLMSIPSWIGMMALAFYPLEVSGTIMGVTWLVGIALWVRFGYSLVAVVDRNMGVGESLKYSLTITKNNGFRLLGLNILISLIAMIGLLACLIPGLFTMPVALMGYTVAYRWMQYGRRVGG